MQTKRKYIEHNYIAQFLLIGFYSELDEIRLDKNLVIKQGTKDDRDKLFKSAKIEKFNEYEFFLEYSYSSLNDTSNSQEAFYLMDKLNFFFHIFYNGHIKISHFPLKAQLNKTGEFLGIGIYSNPKVPIYADGVCSLVKDEVDELKLNWKNFIEIDEDKNKAFNIARRRFLFSTQKYDDEDKLIDLFIVFEALFLDVTEKGELSFKLALRVSYFLRESYDSHEIHEFVKKSYNLRSLIVHGSNVKSNEIKFNGHKLTLDAVVFQLTDFLQFCFRIYILEFSHMTISDFIKNIDNSIINTSKD